MDDHGLFFKVREVDLNIYNLQFSLVNRITQQIFVALGPNLYHRCISGVDWLRSNMDYLDLFFEVMRVNFNMQIFTFHL